MQGYVRVELAPEPDRYSLHQTSAMQTNIWERRGDTLLELENWPERRDSYPTVVLKNCGTTLDWVEK